MMIQSHILGSMFSTRFFRIIFLTHVVPEALYSSDIINHLFLLHNLVEMTCLSG